MVTELSQCTSKMLLVSRQSKNGRWKISFAVDFFLMNTFLQSMPTVKEGSLCLQQIRLIQIIACVSSRCCCKSFIFAICHCQFKWTVTQYWPNVKDSQSLSGQRGNSFSGSERKMRFVEVTEVDQWQWNKWNSRFNLKLVHYGQKLQSCTAGALKSKTSSTPRCPQSSP